MKISKFSAYSCRLLVCLAMLLGFFQFVGVAQGQSAVWELKTESEVQGRGSLTMMPNKYLVYSLNQDALKQILRQAPLEFTEAARLTKTILELPAPDGSLQRFYVEESPMMEPELAAKFPEIKTYHGQGIDDPTATLRFDLMPSGFHSQILSASGTILVNPFIKGDTENYISYFKKDAVRTENWTCHFGDSDIEDFFKVNKDYFSLPDAPDISSGTSLRTYRLALAADGEYTQAVGGGTVAGAMAAQVLIMNRVNGIYERELAVRLTLVANNNLIIYTNPATDPYSNTNPNALLTQNQSTLTSVIGTANYDIGHVFTTGGGGLAGLGVVCNSNNKARAETGLPNPIGDDFAVDYVAHEMGHQFGGNHTFNASDGNREPSAAFEPGSGITIMGYAGLFGAQDLAAHSIDTFHVRSLEEIITFKTTGGGNTAGCGSTAANGNTIPTVSGPGTFNIPRTTPFALTATASDANGDPITYDWEEYDLGAASTEAPNTDADGNARPIFRPYLPTTSPTRFFPSLTYILNSNNVPPTNTGGFMTGEILPAISRTMNFQVVVRDNRTGGGGVNTATAQVIVNAAAGPFNISNLNTSTSFTGNTMQTVTWNVAGTTAAPINAANVRILLSTDGGNTFPTVLAASTPNDGSQAVTIPNTPTTQARIKVEAVGNIFFDINNSNLTILAAPTAASVSVSGRVMTESGRGIRNAVITLTDGNGNARTTQTTSLGYYRFEGVAAGATYFITATGMRFTFEQPTQVLNVLEDSNEINFIGEVTNNLLTRYR